MVVSRWAALLGLWISGVASAQPVPNALVLRDRPSNWGTCPGGESEEAELAFQGVPHTTVNPAAFATVDIFDYTMIFVAGCQDASTYSAFNARQAELDTWVRQGGFIGVHATRDCGPFSAVGAEPPGGAPTRVAEFSYTGVAHFPGHPILVGVPNPVNSPGIGFTYDSYPNTGNPNDNILITADDTGNAVLFERVLGEGTIIYGGLTYSYYNLRCGSIAGGWVGNVVANEVSYGATHTLCGTVDSDDDGVGDDCDACPGFDDRIDSDGDGVPDACDPCPHLPEPSDLNFNGICDDVDDSDDDGIPDAYDVCPGHDDNLDADVDGVPDGCDNCPFHPDPDQYDGDGDGYGIPCDCDDANPSVHPGADEYCNGIDDDCDGVVDGATALDAQTWWVDADGDGHGDVFSATVTSCEPPLGYVSRGGDCNDADVTIHPDAIEKCDDIDQNCDGDPLIEGCPRDELSGGCNTTPSPLGFAGVILAMGLAVRRRRAA